MRKNAMSSREYSYIACFIGMMGALFWLTYIILNG